MGIKAKSLLLLFFFTSGFCSLIYQIVWLRLAFAHFGVITPVVSLILSVFMMGLALGSWTGGAWVAKLRDKSNAILAYASAEWVIGVGAFAVPALFVWGESQLLSGGTTDSFGYLALSGFLILATLLPWCFCMGLTVPLMMGFIQSKTRDHESSFSFLYLANVLGAAAGAAATAVFLVEIFGFQMTLGIAAFLNFSVGAGALSLRWILSDQRSDQKARATQPLAKWDGSRRFLAAVLFLTGFTSMGMEVVWTRAFTPITTTTIYAFALLLCTYLIATGVGSFVYRQSLARRWQPSIDWVLAFLAVASVLPLMLNDPRLKPEITNVIFSLFPLCAGLGFLTPLLVDQYSRGEPRSAGQVYALNILGCILGPLFAGYVLLPTIGVKSSLLLLALPFFLLYVVRVRKPASQPLFRKWALTSILGLFAIGMFVNTTFENGSLYGKSEVRRDYTATTIAYGSGMDKRLLVNGVGMTGLTPITKLMAHFPMSLFEKSPEKGLVICFGMGTTFRSALTWGTTHVTAVDLVPGVRDSFPFFFQDASEVASRPLGRIVIDDGRRFLKRTDEKFDFITIDPPPPIEAAGTSLLYSLEFYQTAKKKLKPDGLLAQWIPIADKTTLAAVVGSVLREFPYVRAFKSIEGWGYHFFASFQPLEVPDAEGLLARIPERARADMMEWYPGDTPERILKRSLAAEVDPRSLLDGNRMLLIADDVPFNEYYLIRKHAPALDRSLSRFKARLFQRYPGLAAR